MGVKKKIQRETEIQRRSNCPVCAALDIFGDKWSLLVVRDIMLFGKTSYGEFLASPERIATNILADRLQQLESAGIIQKSKNPKDKRKDVYTLTNRGVDLVPMVAEMMLWSVKYNQGVRIPELLVKGMEKDREGTLQHVRQCAIDGIPLLK